MHLPKLILLVIGIAGILGTARSQKASPFIFNSAGGSYDYQFSYYRFEWSIGEMAVITTMNSADSSCRLLHGVLQPGTENPVYPRTVLYETGDYTAFPNPTTGRFEVNFFVPHPGRMQLQLTDATGRTLETRSYLYDGVRRIQLFDLSKYPNGLYYVNATLTPEVNRAGDNLQIIRSNGLRIIKIQ